MTFLQEFSDSDFVPFDNAVAVLKGNQTSEVSLDDLDASETLIDKENVQVIPIKILETLEWEDLLIKPFKGSFLNRALVIASDPKIKKQDLEKIVESIIMHEIIPAYLGLPGSGIIYITLRIGLPHASAVDVCEKMDASVFESFKNEIDWLNDFIKPASRFQNRGDIFELIKKIFLKQPTLIKLFTSFIKK